MTKRAEQLEARRLRSEEGESIKVIAGQLGVAPSSVSRLVRDIDLSDDQVEALVARNARFAGQNKGHQVRRAAARAQRATWQAEGRKIAREGDPLHRAGCMLHWAEGSKYRCSVTFCNSDVDMMRLFVRFLRECYLVELERLTFSVNCFVDNGLSLQEIESSWLDALGLPRTCLRTATVNRASSASKRTGRVLRFGTGRVTLHSTEVAQSIYGAIQEYGGFDRTEWLD